MPKLTDEQKKKYVENGTLRCPFCESPDISGRQVQIEGTQAWQEVSCGDCGETWQDVYNFAFVETQDELNGTS